VRGIRVSRESGRRRGLTKINARVRARITPTKIHTCRDESNRVSGDVYVEHRDLADNFE